MKIKKGELLFFCFLFIDCISFSVEDVICRKIKQPREITPLLDGRIRLRNNFITITSTYEEMSRATVELLIERMRAIVKERGEVKIGLPTGNTPRKIYEILRTQFRDDSIWESVILVQLDEYVGADPHLPESFQYQLRENLVNHVKLKRFLGIKGNAKDIREERERYEKELLALGGLDILVLGIGQNGHLAFNEPGFTTEDYFGVVELSSTTREINKVDFTHAYTLTLKTILEAKEIILIASGVGKRRIVCEALLGEIDSSIPASFLQKHPHTTYIIDQGAVADELWKILAETLRDAVKEVISEGRVIKVLATDFDFTLSPIGSKVRDSVIDKLSDLAKKGIHIAIVTGARYERLEEQFLKHLPPDFPWENLSVYVNLGASGYRFDAQGNPLLIYPEIEFLPQHLYTIERVVESFRQQFPHDFEDMEIVNNVKCTIYLTEKVRTREIYERYLTFLEEYLKDTGLVINGAGHLGSIDITCRDKFFALDDLVKRLGVEREEIIYVGDTFSGKFGNDLPMVSPGVLVFNVGSTDAVPSKIFSLGIRGDLGTELLLEALLNLLK